jgi:hypothetical protein
MGAVSKRREGNSRAGALVCIAAALTLGEALAACEEDRARPGPRSSDLDNPEQDGGELLPLDDAGGPPAPDAGGLCGNLVHDAISDAPNIYFVLDASGSMDSLVSSRATRYERVHDAAVELVRNLGPLINVGAAVFPLSASNTEPCRPGGEVFPVTRGDALAEDPTDGTTTQGFRATTNVVPFGGTPTAATLRALTDKLSALTGKTIVLLATDGGPNCNASLSCDADECIANIEEQCSPGVNCCAPSGPAGPENCIDREETVDAVAELAANGIDVYVIGIPGSETYGGVLDGMALAGGVPRFVSPFYYKVGNLDALGGVLSTIASVVVSCEFDLVDPPPQEGLTNVYLDRELVPYDPENGWYWRSPSIVELRGDACARLKGGKVRQVQIVSGCPTEVAK